MHLAERQNHLANELALWRRQLKECVKGLTLQVAHTRVPTLAVRLNRVLDFWTKAQNFGLHFQQAG